MAFKAGKSAFILMDSIAGTGVDVSAYADNFSFPVPVDTLDTTTFGASGGAKSFIVGLNGGGSPSMSGPLDVGLGTFIAALVTGQAAGSASCTVVFAPGGSVSGLFKETAETWITDFSVSTSVGGRSEYSCNLQITGATTMAAW